MRIRFTRNDSALGKALRHQRLDELGLGLIGISAFVAVMGFAFPGGVCAAPPAPDLIIRVRVYNYAGTPSTMLAEAEREASRILGEAGLRSAWLDCPIVPATDIPQNPCPEPIEAVEVRLRILSVPVRNSLHDTAYGFAIAPALASVYSESALRFARNDEGELEAPIVLGCAIAHEIGHLLLGSNSHSVSGVMCAHWERKHIRQALMGAMLFSPAEAKLIQAEMRRRTTS
jgi:hypothetical protein